MTTDQRPDGAAADDAASTAPATPAADASPSSGADAEPAQAAGTDLAAELEAARAEARTHYDAFVRARAEMENIRRRAQDDVSKAHKFALEGFAESLVPVLDSLELALKVEAPTVENLREGVQATLRLLAGAFEKHRLVAIDPLGERFDPNRHQAISMVPAASTQPPVPPNHVAAVLQKGYLIHDRVLRPALVTVAQG